MSEVKEHYSLKSTSAKVLSGDRFTALKGASWNFFVDRSGFLILSIPPVCDDTTRRIQLHGAKNGTIRKDPAAGVLDLVNGRVGAHELEERVHGCRVRRSLLRHLGQLAGVVLRRQAAIEHVVAEHDATRRKQSVLHDELVASRVHGLVQIHEDEIRLLALRGLLLQEGVDLRLDNLSFSSDWHDHQ